MTHLFSGGLRANETFRARADRGRDDLATRPAFRTTRAMAALNIPKPTTSYRGCCGRVDALLVNRTFGLSVPCATDREQNQSGTHRAKN